LSADGPGSRRGRARARPRPDDFPFADEGLGFRFLLVLHQFIDDDRACGIREAAQFAQRIMRVRVMAGQQASDEDRTLLHDGGTGSFGFFHADVILGMRHTAAY